MVIVLVIVILTEVEEMKCAIPENEEEIQQILRTNIEIVGVLYKKRCEEEFVYCCNEKGIRLSN